MKEQRTAQERLDLIESECKKEFEQACRERDLCLREGCEKSANW